MNNIVENTICLATQIEVYRTDLGSIKTNFYLPVFDNFYENDAKNLNIFFEDLYKIMFEHDKECQTIYIYNKKDRNYHKIDSCAFSKIKRHPEYYTYNLFLGQDEETQQEVCEYILSRFHTIKNEDDFMYHVRTIYQKIRDKNE